MTEEEKVTIIELSCQGLNDGQIAEIVHYSRGHVSATLRNIGLSRKRGKRCILPRETIAKLCELRRCGLSYQQIGKEMKMNKYTVYEVIKREQKGKPK